MNISPAVFEEIGDQIFSRAHGLSFTTRIRRFSALFGVSPNVCAYVWAIIYKNLPNFTELDHLIWANLFLKIYATEFVNCVLTGPDCKAYRKWV